MKYSLLFCLTLFVSASHALTLQDVVLGEDAMESPTVYSFPCSKYIDIMSCETGYLILEKNCKATLKIEKRGLSCRSLNGDVVVFATVIPGSRFFDRTSDGMNGYRLNFSPRVSLATFKTPNGNTEYQIIVK